MGRVTEVLLSWDTLEDHAQLTASINSWLEIRGLGTLVDVSPYAGGTKGFKHLLAGSFNHLSASDFLAMLQSQPWQDPQYAQLLLRHEEEPAWQLLHIATSALHYLPSDR